MAWEGRRNKGNPNWHPPVTPTKVDIKFLKETDLSKKEAIRAAARKAGVTERTVRSQMRKHGIPTEDDTEKGGES